tara:strand:- start:2965 stop:3870 length:906 start_codon:yes stop_codon:yes gene_type:complete
MELSEKTFPSQANYYLTGIVPIAGQSLDFNLPYPDCMLPIAPNYTLIEAAITECAYAGCDTIWVVCNDDIAPIVRHTVGDYIEDPMYFYNSKTRTSDTRRRIPIFWVPIHPKDRDKRDCLSWSVLHGALSALKVSSQISKWTIPDKYYVSFPYGYFIPDQIWKSRKVIKSNKNFYISSNGKTVQDNIYTSFTFGKEGFVKFRRNVRKGTGVYTTDVVDSRGIPRSKMPLEQRWSARFFELNQVFKDLELDASNVLEVEYANIGSWPEYIEFMRSKIVDNLKRPPKELYSYKEFNPVAKDVD